MKTPVLLLKCMKTSFTCLTFKVVQSNVFR